MSDIIPILSQIDTRILIGIAIVAGVVLIYSLIKKAVKSVAFLLVVAIIATAGVPFINNLKDNYGISYDKTDEIIYFKAAGTPIEIPLKEIKEAKNYSISLEKGTTDTKISLYYERKDGTAVSEQGSNALKIPNYMADVLCTYLDKVGITYNMD